MVRAYESKRENYPIENRKMVFHHGSTESKIEFLQNYWFTIT